MGSGYLSQHAVGQIRAMPVVIRRAGLTIRQKMQRGSYHRAKFRPKQARTQDFRMGARPLGWTPHAGGPPAKKKKRLLSSIHPGRFQSQDGPSQAKASK